MAKKTIYCVQAFWKNDRKLAMGAMRQFKTEEAAREAGLSASRRNVGVLVYSVEGCAELDDWGDPRVLARHGDVPRT